MQATRWTAGWIVSAMLFENQTQVVHGSPGDVNYAPFNIGCILHMVLSQIIEPTDIFAGAANH